STPRIIGMHAQVSPLGGRSNGAEINFPYSSGLNGCPQEFVGSCAVEGYVLDGSFGQSIGKWCPLPFRGGPVEGELPPPHADGCSNKYHAMIAVGINGDCVGRCFGALIIGGV